MTINDLREAVYQNDLCAMIENEIYPYMNTFGGDWRLGKLHREWNRFLNDYKCILVKAPRGHLKTFFFFETFALRECKLKKGIDIRYFTSGDSLGIEKMDNIKELLSYPYFKDLLVGGNINNRGEVMLAGKNHIEVQGFGTRVRGGHPDYIILDDVIDAQVIYSDDYNLKMKERVAMEILPMAEPHTKIIVIGTVQRAGDLYDVEYGSDWVNKSYDAIIDEEKHITLYPEKWDWDRLMKKRDDIVSIAGLQYFNKEYRNMPITASGEIIKPEWIKFYDNVPTRVSVYSGWDLSTGRNPDEGDFTAKVSFALDDEQPFPNIYILDVYFERIDFGKRVREVIAQGAMEEPIRIAIEDNVFQADTVQAAKKNSNLNILGVRTGVNKVEKYHQVLVPLFENGRVYFKKGCEKQAAFVAQLTSLPRGKHDDIADAFCTGLSGIISMKAEQNLIWV